MYVRCSSCINFYTFLIQRHTYITVHTLGCFVSIFSPSSVFERVCLCCVGFVFCFAFILHTCIWEKQFFFGCLFFVRLNNAFLFEDFSNLFEFFHIFFKIFQISVCQHTNFASSQTHNKCNTCVHTNFLCVLVFAYFSGPYQKMQCKKISAHAVFYCTFYFSSFIHAWPLKKLQAFTSVATTKLTRK